MRLIRRRTEISCSEGIGFPGLEGAGSDLLKQMLLNLVVQGEGAMSVECGEVDRALQLYGQLGS
jgi:hypothetical protein